jgi:protein-arginine kinase activator protein McsA
MKAESSPTELVGRDIVEVGPFKCSRCGSTLKSFQDWIMGDEDILCASCYQSMISPSSHRVCAEVLE